MNHADVCVSIRMVRKTEPGEPGSLEAALGLIGELKPSRLEWSYTWKDEAVLRPLRDAVPVYVAALNTIAPPGHAESFEGNPVIAPWMKAFGTPERRCTYMCQNNPADVQARIDQAGEIAARGLTDTFQFDDWYCNAQMIGFGNPCFCRHCLEGFSEELGLDAPLDYRRYLRRRGFDHTQQLLDAARRHEVPLWDDYTRFQQRTVTRFFRKLRAAMDRFLGRPATLSVNGSVLDFGGRIETVLPFVTYLHGETPDFSPRGLKRLAEASRKLGVRQVVSFFPDVDADAYHGAPFVARVKQAIGLAYCLGLLPLFPYDVYAGDKPRWYGRWEEYAAPYTLVREHPDWFDGYRWKRMKREGDAVVVEMAPAEGRGPGMTHRLHADGTWDVVG